MRVAARAEAPRKIVRDAAGVISSSRPGARASSLGAQGTALAQGDGGFLSRWRLAAPPAHGLDLDLLEAGSLDARRGCESGSASPNGVRSMNRAGSSGKSRARASEMGCGELLSRRAAQALKR